MNPRAAGHFDLPRVGQVSYAADDVSTSFYRDTWGCPLPLHLGLMSKAGDEGNACGTGRATGQSRISARSCARN
jgi:hypothetical protein